MKMSCHENADDEDLDDPIKLVDYEQDRFLASATQVIDVDETTLGLDDLCESLEPAEHHKASTQQIKVSSCEKTFALSDNFFSITENVELFNKCQPLNIKIVDCSKHPFYYNKYIFCQGDKNNIDDVSIISVSMEISELNSPNTLNTNKCNVVRDNVKGARKCNEYSKMTHDTMHNENATKLQPCRRLLTEKWLSNQQAKQDNEKIVAISKKNSTKVDYKKNTGLIGLKIRRTDCHDKPTEKDHDDMPGDKKKIASCKKTNKDDLNKMETVCKKSKEVTNKVTKETNVETKDESKNKLSYNKVNLNKTFKELPNSNLVSSEANKKIIKNASPDVKPKSNEYFNLDSNKTELRKRVSTDTIISNTDHAYKKSKLCNLTNSILMHKEISLPSPSTLSIKEKSNSPGNLTTLRTDSSLSLVKKHDNMKQTGKLPFNKPIKTPGTTKRSSNEIAQKEPDKKTLKIMGEVQKNVSNELELLTYTKASIGLKIHKIDTKNKISNPDLTKGNPISKLVLDTSQQMINFLNSESTMLSKSFEEKGVVKCENSKSNIFANLIKRTSPSAKAKVKIHPIKPNLNSSFGCVSLNQDPKTFQEAINKPKSTVQQNTLSHHTQITHNQDDANNPILPLLDHNESLLQGETARSINNRPLVDPRKHYHPLRQNLMTVPIQQQILDSKTCPTNIAENEELPRNIMNDRASDQNDPLIKGTPLPRMIPTYQNKKQLYSTANATIKTKHISKPQKSLHLQSDSTLPILPFENNIKITQPPINNDAIHRNVLPDTNNIPPQMSATLPLSNSIPSVMTAYQPHSNATIPPVTYDRQQRLYNVPPPMNFQPEWNEPYQNYHAMPPISDVMPYLQYNGVSNYNYNITPNMNAIYPEIYMYPQNVDPNYFWYAGNGAIPPPPPPSVAKDSSQYKNTNNNELTNHQTIDGTIIGKNDNGIVRKINILTATNQETKAENAADPSVSRKLSIIQKGNVGGRRKFVPSKLPSESLNVPKFKRYVVCPRRSAEKKETSIVKPSKKFSEVKGKPNIPSNMLSQYSPPILPIPTYQRTLEFLGQVNTDQCNFLIDKSGTLQNCVVGKNRLTELIMGNEMAAKKISIAEYKNRLPNKYDSRCIDLTGDDKNDMDNMEFPVYVHHRSESQDLGYASDTTIKL